MSKSNVGSAANKSPRKPREKRSDLPEKPYKEFPLTPHPGGRWQKKIRGEVYYFGRWGRVRDGKMERLAGDGWQEALAIFQAQRDDLMAGRAPQTPGDERLTVNALCNRFLSAKLTKFKAGRLKAEGFEEYKKMTDRLVRVLGGNTVVDNLRPADFEKLLADIRLTYGLVREGIEIVHVRSVFKYALLNGLLAKPVAFGSEFAVPDKNAMRRHRAAGGKRMFTAAEIRTLLDSATPAMKAMILLGVNCGFGNTDVGGLQLSDVTTEWISYSRQKTGADRRCPLWPETIAAIKAAIAVRPRPYLSADANCVFITNAGNRWSRTTVRMVAGSDGVEFPKAVRADAVGEQFAKLLRLHEINGRRLLGFYSLRHNFRTIADAAKDNPATRLIMGHIDASIDDAYREHIDDDRLRAVVNHVHDWLFATEGGAT